LTGCWFESAASFYRSPGITGCGLAVEVTADQRTSGCKKALLIEPAADRTIRKLIGLRALRASPFLHGFN
jgi:hypothetical protein